MMELGDAAMFYVLIEAVFAIVLTFYAVKIGRRVVKLLDALAEAVESK